MNNTLLPFERLTGRENFTNWKIGAKAYLITKGYYSEMCQGLATDAKPEVCAKNQKALAELTLLVDPCVYSHLEECDTAKSGWDALMAAFEDKGVIRKVTLLKQWISLN